jgi:predicted  nucleic acid-binding Zn-ribbon protein
MNFKITAAFAILTALVACDQEDPELVRQRGEQEVEIAELKGKLALMEERLKFMPADKSAELAAAKRETKELESERKRLAEELAALEEERRKIQQEYEEYKRKYVVR